MSESSLLSVLAFLVPAGYALIAAAGLPTQRSRNAAIGFSSALGLAVLGYMLTGFALQFGGIGLVYERPGYEGLIWEWSALGPTWGAGWGMAGLAGWLLSGAADTSAARSLALANLPWVTLATMIPLVALRSRIPAWASALLGFLTGALIYPLAGNWIWGGGWLANLSANLGLGHGIVDIGGAALVHVLGASVALAGLLAFLPRAAPSARGDEPEPLPRLYVPAFSLLGPVLVLAGTVAWLSANPLLPQGGIDPARTLVNIVLMGALGGLASLSYTWLVAGQPDPLMSARGFGAAVAASMALAPFVPAWAALVTGVLLGLLTPLAIFLFDRLLRLEQDTAVLTVHGLGGLAGLLLLGVLADGKAGAGWNGVGAESYLRMAGQGVTGLLAASPFVADFPGQLQAQAIGLAAVALFAFFASWLLLAPPAIVLQMLGPRRAVVPPSEPAVAPALPETLPAIGEDPNKAGEIEVTPALPEVSG